MTEATTSAPLTTLNEQLLAAAATFSDDASSFGALLAACARDIERMQREPLEIFPVCHHSPASALHMVRRLREHPPAAIYLELCEDLLPLVEHLRDCMLPIALQAFAGESAILPPELLPVAVVAPLTEASAEFQAIAYALAHPETTQLVFVDRAVDFVFQWDSEWQAKLQRDDEDAPDDEEAALHGTAVGVTVGALEPTFDEFLHFLLRNSNTRHFSEWWEQYVERAIIHADYATYRETMVLVGSLIRRLGTRTRDLEEDRLRERHMWTRIKQHMAAHGIAPADALHICGAAHAASDVEEFGTHSALQWELPARSATRWLYGIIPSSYRAIEYQFGHPAGTVGLAAEAWAKALKADGLKAFDLKKPDKAQASKSGPQGPRVRSLLLTQTPSAAVDQEQLLGWSANIVALARKNGYLASTADSIAIYQTALLLAQLRNRPHPSSYDFLDAAVTCLEKDRTPKKRTIVQLCQQMLGGDKTGSVGYASLPPLAQDIYDRLAPLALKLQATTNQRALMDFKANPALHPCSDLLWKLNYLLGDAVVKPIVGERTLGFVPVQESWDVRLGKHQRALIELGYEGVTIEQVLEQRLKRTAFGEQATAAITLECVEHTLLLMNSPRLVRELGEHATNLLTNEAGGQDAPSIFRRARRLVHFYRAGPDGLPEWLQRFVATGYAHYAALLPRAFADRGTTPAQIAAMLGFIFTLESFALALGAQRNQLFVNIQQAGHSEPSPDKLGLLWTAEWLLDLRAIAAIRAHLQGLLNDALRLPTLPEYVSGFVLALTFAPSIARFVVELLSEIFGSVPDPVLLPLLPGLLLQLREHKNILQPLIKEAATIFPPTLAQFSAWQPAWMEQDTSQAAAQDSELPSASLSSTEEAVRALLAAAPATADALAHWLGAIPFSSTA